MKISALLPLLLAATALRAAPEPRPLRFDRAPLGNVARVLGARLHATVAIEANAAAPVSGDFSRLEPGAALAEAARQAGLVVAAEGAAGFRLKRPAPEPSPAERAAPILAAAERERAGLLRRRAELLKQEAELADVAPLAP